MNLELNSQAIEDLLWVVNSPSLVNENEKTPCLTREQIDPIALESHLDVDSSSRVGRYFERLVQFWLEHIRGVEMIACGQQVKEGTKTIGEIDFVFRNESGVVEHWETAVKFYLHCPRESGSHFPGPNARDNLEAKLDKLFGQQLKLGRKVYSEVEVCRAFIRGRIHHHISEDGVERLPERVSPSHSKGAWMWERELQWLDRFNADRGMILEKPNWLARPVDDSGMVEIGAMIDQIRRHFRDWNTPVLASLENALPAVFVVPNSWPGDADE